MKVFVVSRILLEDAEAARAAWVGEQVEKAESALAQARTNLSRFKSMQCRLVKPGDKVWWRGDDNVKRPSTVVRLEGNTPFGGQQYVVKDDESGEEGVVTEGDFRGESPDWGILNAQPGG